MPDYVSRLVRTAVQLLAAGAFSQVFLALTDYVPVEHQTLLTGFFALVVVFAQNLAEDKGVIPTLLGKVEQPAVSVKEPRVL